MADHHIIQAFGGRAVDETGKKVTFNSPETVAGVQWLADVYTKPEYKKALPPGVESWTDTSNNEAYLAGKLGHHHKCAVCIRQGQKGQKPGLRKHRLAALPDHQRWQA